MDVGDKFVDRGVVSATLKPSPKNSKEEWFEIEAVAGSHARYAGGISEIKEQAEVILSADSVFEMVQKANPEKGILARFRVAGVEKHSDGIQKAWLEVVEAAKKEDKAGMIAAAKKWG